MQGNNTTKNRMPEAKRKFRLGNIGHTLGASRAFSREEIWACIRRHASGDWGNLCPEDREGNERALSANCPGRIMSIYEHADGRTLWVVTEADRSITTALLPEEY